MLEISLKEAVDKFVSEYWKDPSGMDINFIGRTNTSITVGALSQATLDSLPDEYCGYPVSKRISGKIIPAKM